MLNFPLWKKILVCFVIALFTWWAVPNILSADMRARIPEWAGGKTVNLGLDLRGGSHLLLEVDTRAYLKERIQNLRGDLRARLLREKIGYSNIRVANDGVKVTLRPETFGDKNIRTLLSGISDGVTVDMDDNEATVSYSKEALRQKKLQLIEQSIEIVNRRVNESGTKEPIIQRQGDDQIVLQVPGLSDPSQLKRILGKTANMTFHLVNPNVSLEDIAKGNVPFGTRILPGDDSDSARTHQGDMRRYPVYSKIELSGEMLTNASATFDQGQPVVSFSFNSEGAKRFADITTKNVGRPFAVVLDDKVITAPNIRSPILGGNGIITGNFNVQSANELAMLLRAGALPAPLKIVEERSVGPSLGLDSIEAGKKASIIAVIVVMLFMMISYGLFGIFANIALGVNIVIIMGALSFLQATLTLPGIAGIVLTLGMAVDANVLIYERIREEIDRGRSAVSAVESGFRFAFGTIVDSNITTLIAAFLLYIFGTGTIKGFAVTLTIGILASMFTAILLTRLIVAWYIRKYRPKTIPI
ncbi:MAG: protein translocase subunit SecD [Rickettsiales bacterium]